MKFNFKMATDYHSPLLDNLLASIDPLSLAKTETRMVIACKIADALVEKKMSKKDLAQQLGKQPSTITKWLSGKHDFADDTLTKIGSVLNIDFFEHKAPKQTVKNMPQTPYQALFMRKIELSVQNCPLSKNAVFDSKSSQKRHFY